MLDPFGNVTSIHQASFLPVNFSYDVRGRLSQVQQGARTSSFVYNAKGLLATSTDPLLNTTSYNYNLADRLTLQTLPNLKTIRFAYDNKGRLTSVKTPLGNQHSFTWNLFDLVATYVAPLFGIEANTTNYAYNNDGQVTQIVYPSGKQVSFNYSPTLGTLQSFTTPNGTTQTQFKNGYLISATTPEGLQESYNFMSHSPEWANAFFSSSFLNWQINYYYNADMLPQIITLQASSGSPSATANYAYDNDNLVTQAGSLMITRDAASGLEVGTSLGAKLKSTQSFDASFAELTSRVFTYIKSATITKPLYNLSLIRDGLGRISSSTEIVAVGRAITYAYTYNSTGQLTKVLKMVSGLVLLPMMPTVIAFQPLSTKLALSPIPTILRPNRYGLYRQSL